MNSKQEIVEQFDRMHIALSKIQGMMGFMMYYRSPDHIPDDEIRNMAWLAHDLCTDALTESRPPATVDHHETATDEWSDLNTQIVLKAAADILDLHDPQTCRLLQQRAQELREPEPID